MLAVLCACMMSTIPPACWSQTKAESAMKSLPQTISLDNAFKQALTAINEERKTNNANEFTCTHRFSDFGQHNKIEPYIEFLQRNGLRPVHIKQNQKHFITVELTRQELASRGYGDFRQGDRLVLVFETASAESNDIISFTARLFGRDYP